MRLLGFGDNIVDRFVDRHREYPGGNAVNVAVYTQRAGDHAEYLGVFGTDEAATFLRESIEAEGVSTRECVVKPGDSGIALLRSINGERTFIGGNEGGVTSREPIDLEDGRLEYARSFHVVHTSIYSEVEPSLPRLADTDTLVTFDFSDDDQGRDTHYIAQNAPHIDLALFSGSSLTREESHQLISTAVTAGARLGLITLGADGAMVTDGEMTLTAPAYPLSAEDGLVDTMGAGDAFATGFIRSLYSSGWNKTDPPHKNHLQKALHEGALNAREQCKEEGAFGRSRSVRPKSSD